MATTYTLGNVAKEFPRTCMRGLGQVMFQDNALTGLLFMAGIFWGAYEEGSPLVAWGMIAGLIVSTLTGYFLDLKDENGAQGLWGFNGCLVGCAFPTFMGDTVWMWLGLILCSAMTTWVRTALNKITTPLGTSSFTFPFVLCTWFFLLASRLFAGMPPEGAETPAFPAAIAGTLDLGFGSLVIYWLKGISQVFLINSWVTGIFFLAALAVSSLRAAMWAALSSGIALFVAIVWKAPAVDIASGLYGFSAVLTGIALGSTFCNFSWRATIWSVVGVVVTVFIQGAMNVFFEPMGLATLTGPFCLATWLMLWPGYSFLQPKQ